MKPLLYIHDATCISPQDSFGEVNLDIVHPSVDNKLSVREPSYDGIPPGILRRMGKAVRIGVGAALRLLKDTPVDGIVIGTANGGMEDCIKFLNQIIAYDEGLLAPGNFVQSTANSIASQVAMLGKNLGYNGTHVHRGLSFESALLDVAMLLHDNHGNQYLLGGVDEISTYNYKIDCLGGWFSTLAVSSTDIYRPGKQFSIAGEAATMFLVNAQNTGALASVQAMTTLHTTDEEVLRAHLTSFLDRHKLTDTFDLLLSGESGDERQNGFYAAVEALAGPQTPVARFKHLSGEFPTASSMGLWVGCQLLRRGAIPAHMTKRGELKTPPKRVLLYNCYRGNNMDSSC